MPLKIVCCCETADYRITQKKAKWTEMVCKFSVSASTQPFLLGTSEKSNTWNTLKKLLAVEGSLTNEGFNQSLVWQLCQAKH